MVHHLPTCRGPLFLKDTRKRTPFGLSGVLLSKRVGGNSDDGDANNQRRETDSTTPPLERSRYDLRNLHNGVNL